MIILLVKGLFFMLLGSCGTVIFEKTFGVNEIGNSFELKCEIGVNKTLKSLNWVRKDDDDILIFYHSIDRKRSAITKDNRPFYEVTIQNGVYILKILKIREEFAKRYACVKVVEEDQFSESDIFKLSLDLENHLKDIGDDVNIPCFPTDVTNKTEHNDHGLGVWSKRQGDIIPSNGSYIRNFRNPIDNELSLIDLKLSDTGFFSCYNRGLKVRTIHLQVYDLEKEDASKPFRFKCSKDSSNIKMISRDNRIIYFDSQFLTQKDIYQIDDQGFIRMTSASFQETGIYKCYDEEGLINIYDFTVGGGYLSDLFISQEAGEANLVTLSSQVELGVDILLTCKFSDNWQAIYWKYNDIIIHTVSNNLTISTYFSTRHIFSVPTSSKQDLTLQSITTFGLGKYQCIVQYNQHYSQSNAITLQHSPANIKLKKPSTTNKTLSCGGSQNITFWFFNGTLINMNDKVITEPNHFQIDGNQLILKSEYDIDGLLSCYSHGNIQRQWQISTEIDIPPVNTNQTNATIIPSLTLNILQNLIIFPSTKVLEPSTNIVLTCGVLNDDDSIIYWFIGNQLIFLKSKNITWSFSSKYGSHQLNNELHIINLQEVDVERISYECYTIKQNESVNKSHPFTLPSFKQDSEFVQSSSASLTCHKDAIFWLGANGEALLSFYDQVIDETYAIGDNRTLIINRVSEEQKGIYYCLSDSSTIRTVHFNYLDASDDKVGKDLIKTGSPKMNISSDGNFEFGKKMSFHCHHDFPADLVYWKFENSDIFFVDSRQKQWSKYNSLVEGSKSATKDSLKVNYLTNTFKTKITCYAVQSGLIYKSPTFVVNEIKQNLLTTGLKLSQDGSTSQFTLLCEVTDSTLNNSGIYWTKDDKLMYAMFGNGKQLTKVDQNTSGRKEGSIYYLTISGDLNSNYDGNYACNTYKEVIEQEHEDSTEEKPVIKTVYQSNIITKKFIAQENQYKLTAVPTQPEVGNSLSLRCTYPESIGTPEYVYWAEKKPGYPENFILIHSNEAFDKSYYNDIAVPGFVIPQSAQFLTNSDCMFKKGCTEMILSSASEGHSANYWCMVKPKDQTLKKSTETNVEFTPSLRILVDFKKSDVITCGNNEAKEGIWLRGDFLFAIDDQLLQTTNGISIDDTLTLTLKNFTTAMEGTYKCYSRQNGTLINTWIAFFQAPEVRVDIKDNRQPQLGQDLTMTCHYNELRPELAFWEKKGANGQTIFLYFSGENNLFNESSRIVGKEKENELTMTIFGLLENDIGEYTCHVQLGQDYKEEKRLLSSSQKIELESAKEPQYSVLEGSDILILCRLKENSFINNIYQILWFKDNVLISRNGRILWNSEKYQLNTSSNGLIIKDVKLTDSDTYHCYLRGILFHSFAISVTEQPIITVKPPSPLDGQNGYFLGFGLAILIFGLLALSWYMTRSRGPLRHVQYKD